MNRGNRSFRSGMLFSIIAGAMVDIILCVVFGMLIPIVTLKESLPLNAMPILVIVTLTLSSFFGASVSVTMQHEKKWIAGVGSAVAFLMLLFLCNMLLLDKISERAYLEILGCLVGSVLAVFVQITKKTLGKKGRKRARSR